MSQRATLITDFYENINELNANNVPSTVSRIVDEVIELLNAGRIRVATKLDGQWQVNQWVKKAILLYFRIRQNKMMDAGHTRFFDKIPLKFAEHRPDQFACAQIRVVPDALVRYGAFVGKNTILMPCYVNIGAFIDEGTMIDTWATIGSCAQIGKNVHVSGGAGIGGVLEPLQENPTIIEDNCFIGARSEIVESVIVEENSVISMGVFIGQSTKIYDRETGEIHLGRVPAGSVVVPGSLPSTKGDCHLQCAVIIKKVDAVTRSKTSINELLRA